MQREKLMTTATMQRVIEGAKVLDIKFPGWERLIDTGTLDIGDPDECAITQICGSYEQQIARIGIDDPTALGFHIANSDEEMPSAASKKRQYAELTECWIELIHARRNLAA